MNKNVRNIAHHRVSYYSALNRTKLTLLTLQDLSALLGDAHSTMNSTKQLSIWYRTLRDDDPARAKVFKAQGLPAYCPAGVYLRAKESRKMVESSGLVWVDFDNVHDPIALRNAMRTVIYCAFAYLSVSRTGVHVLFATANQTRSAHDYNYLWDTIVRTYVPDEFKQFIDPASRNMSQLAILPVDTDAFIDLNPSLLSITIPPPKPKPRYIRPRLSVGDQAQQQLRIYKMLDRTRPPDDYPTWLRLLASLKAGGIDRGSADNWSQRGHNYHQKSFHRAWKSLSSSGGITIATFIWWANNHSR